MSDSEQQILQKRLAELEAQNESLQAQNALLRTVLDHLPVGVTLNDPHVEDHPIVYVNKTFTDITGYSAEEVLGRNTRFLQGDDTEQEHIQAMWETQKRQKIDSFVLRNYRKDGTPFWNHFTLIPLAVAGQIERYMGIQADVTEQVETSQALTASERYLQTVLDHLPLFLFAMDKDGIVTLSKGQGLEKLGVEPGSGIGVSAFHMYRKYPLVIEAMHQALKGNSVEMVAEVNDLHYQTRYEPVLDANGEIAGCVGIALDISNEWHAQTQLRLMEFSVQTSNDGICWVRADGTFLEANNGLCLLTGYNADELRAMHVYDLSENLTAAGWNQNWPLLQERKSQVNSSSIQTKNGRSIPVNIRMDYLDFEGQELAFLHIQDISEQVRAQQALAQQEQRIRALYEISTRTDLTLAQQLTMLLKVGSAQLGLNNGILSHIDGSLYKVEYVYAPNTSLETGQEFPLGNTYCAITLQANEVVAIHHAQESQYKGHPCHNLFELEAYIGVPLIVNNERYGTLNFSDATPHHPFSPSDLDFVRLMGQWASSTIEREQAQAQLQARLEEITTLNEMMRLLTNIDQLQPIMQTIVDKVGRLFKTKHTSLSLLSEDGTELELMANYTRFDTNAEYDARENVVGYYFVLDKNKNLRHVIQTKRPIILKDAQNNPDASELHAIMKNRGTHCLMLVPLVARGEVVGLMGVDLDQEERVFTSEERRLAETIAGQVAGAIDNARLYKAAQHEIEEHKRTEQALQVARDDALEANRLKDQFLAKVSHELRTPLGAIVGYAELLEEGVYGDVTARQARTLGEMIGSANYLTSLVNELLDIAKLESGEITLDHHTFQVLDLFRSVRSQMKILAENKGVTLEIDLDDSLPPHLMGDVHRLRQILVNLVGNAVKFTQQGEVVISAFRPTPKRWAFSVKDSGIGIPQEAQAYVFEAFRQVNDSASSKFKGTGLGLAIVKQLVELMQGEVTLESEEGVGTTFTVILPLHMM